MTAPKLIEHRFEISRGIVPSCARFERVCPKRLRLYSTEGGEASAE